jgi:hypothetical protein
MSQVLRATAQAVRATALYDFNSLISNTWMKAQRRETQNSRPEAP